MIKSYFDFPGSLLTGAGNYVKKNVSDGQKYSFEASEFPILKRFIFDPYKNPQTITDYYDKRNELNRKYVRPKIKPVGEDAKLLSRIKAALRK